ncbi:MAG TPA: HAD family hydrolase [Gaiellaceae bacterium]|nr:HAD family hydrolase [Gaiellaceae bacterium]
MTSLRVGVFLDRDGVLNQRPRQHDYVRSPEGFGWLPGAAEAVARLGAAGFAVIVVSNQRGIARGLVSWETIRAIERLVRQGAAEHGGSVAGFYYCPHETDAGCDCRKPAPGLLVRAAAEHRIDISASTMIGDSESDVEAGRAAGCRTIRIAEAGTASSADAVCESLAAAVDCLTEPSAGELARA